MNLNTVQEIERAIDALTPDQREELYVWLDEHYLQSGDLQLKAAIDAGSFDDRIARALADHRPEERNPSSSGPPDAPRQRGILERVSGFGPRGSRYYRALALKVGDDHVWFWIGEHDTYERMI